MRPGESGFLAIARARLDAGERCLAERNMHEGFCAAGATLQLGAGWWVACSLSYTYVSGSVCDVLFARRRHSSTGASGMPSCSSIPAHSPARSRAVANEQDGFAASKQGGKPDSEAGVLDASAGVLGFACHTKRLGATAACVYAGVWLHSPRTIT